MKLSKFVQDLHNDVNKALREKDPVIMTDCHIRASVLTEIFEPEELTAMLGDDAKTFALVGIKLMLTPPEVVLNWADEREEL